MKPFAFFQAARTAQVFNVGLSFALAGIPVFGPATSFAQTPPPVYPEVGPTTHFVNQDTVLSGFSEPAWYKANVPFIDLPDQTIENVTTIVGGWPMKRRNIPEQRTVGL
jgi:hypothetical protein